MRLVILFFVFLLLGAFFIVSNENLHLKDKAEFDQFAELYYGWFGDLFSNAKSMTGYIVKAEWMPSND